MRAKSAGGFTLSVASLLAFAFAAGVLLRLYAPLWVCVVIATAAIICARHVDTRYRAATTILTAVFFLGAWRYDVELRVPRDDVSRLVSHASALQGVVASDPETNEARASFVLRVERARIPSGWVDASGRVMVSIYAGPGCAGMLESCNSDERLGLEYGDRIIMRARLYEPPAPSNPGGFSWKGYLTRKGIYVCASVHSWESVRVLPTRGGNIAVRFALRGRHALTDAVRRVYPWPESTVIAGMVLGTYAYLPLNVVRDFSRTGTLHLLAASGYNCWVVVFLLSPLLKRMRILPKWRGLVITGALAAYVLAVGGKPSLVRAALMASLALLAGFLNRAPDVKNLFFVAALIILAVEPSDLFDIGFQLSFLSVWGIINISPVLGAVVLLRRAGIVNSHACSNGKSLRQLSKKVIAGLGVTAIATLSAMLVTAPLIAYYFNYVSLAALPANLAVELGVPVVFGAGLLAPAAGWVPSAAQLIGYTGTVVTRGMLWIGSWLGSARFSALSVPSPPVFAVVVYYLILYGVLYRLRTLSCGSTGKRNSLV
ncbi:MAG: ComEC/Rec2 family competence protein [Armatimonadota bacterium]|nr:ComEC/Rec2 family competence protein [Armatimonadota bacterium]